MGGYKIRWGRMLIITVLAKLPQYEGIISK